MDYEKLAREFFEMHFLRARQKIDLGKIISASGEEGVLLSVFHSKGKILVGDICRQLGLSPGRVTNIIKILEKRGYVAKEQGVQDRRRVYITLTEDGEKHIERKYREAVERHRLILERMGEHDAQEYFRLVKKIHEIDESFGVKEDI